MAGLSPLPKRRSQIAAVASLRGRLFINAFQRKGARGELIARVLLMPLFALLALGPVVGAGFAGYYIVAEHEYSFFPYLLWFIFFLWQTFVISTKTVAPTFDLGMLIRFPLRFSTYLTLRLLFGLLDVPTVLCSLALLAAAIGVGVARPALFLPVAGVFLVFAVTVVLFFRMVFLWFDRWFAQRKTREILVALFFVAMLAFQFANVTFNLNSHARRDPVARAQHAKRIAMLKQAAHTASPFLRALPPGLAATAATRIAMAKPADAAPPLVGLTAFAGGFLLLFSRRLRGEFQGESFNEAPPRTATTVAALAPQTASSAASSVVRPPGLSFAQPSLPPAASGPLSPATTAVIGKELRYLVRSQPLLFALITPIFMVFLIVTRTSFARTPTEWMLPSTLAYVLLGLTAGMYNILGTEGAGVQLYFLAPIRLRDVVIGKNLVSLCMVSIEVAIASTIVMTASGVPPLPLLCATYLWLAFTLTLNVTLGNIRSVYAPRVIDLGKFRQGRQGQLNVLIGLGVLVMCLALGAATLFLARHVGHPWLPAPVFAVLAAVAVAFYRSNLNHLAQIALDRRETISAELCRI